MSYHRWIAVSAALFLLLLSGLMIALGSISLEFLSLAVVGFALAAACWLFERRLVSATERLAGWSLLFQVLEFIGWVLYCVVVALTAT